MKFFPIFLPFFPPAGDFYGFSAVALARFALIRRRRAKLLAVFLPHPGEGFWGCAWRYVVPRGNGDPACWRPAGGRGSAVRQWLVVARDFWRAVPLRSG